MFNWIPYLWAIQDAWGSTWGAGFAAVGCVGLVLTGAVWTVADGRARRKARDRGYSHDGADAVASALFSGAGMALVGCFWPLVLIALPFIGAAALLFGSGAYVANHVRTELERREVEG